jgi:hypothetical protein
MEAKEIQVPVRMGKVIGIELKVTVPGQNQTEVAMLKCDAPLPPNVYGQNSAMNITVHTTEGDINFAAVSIPNPKGTSVYVEANAAQRIYSEVVSEYKAA